MSERNISFYNEWGQVTETLTKQNYSPADWKNYLQVASERIEKKDKKEANAYKEKFKEFMREYSDENHNMLEENYNKYKKASHPDFIGNYKLLGNKRLKKTLSRCRILVLTANPIEKAVLHYYVVSELEKPIYRIVDGNIIYFIFKWQKYWVAHIHQPQMGSHTDMGSYVTINNALKKFRPNMILSLGVAFGIDYEKQNLGDVLVSRRVLPYDENKRKEEKIIPNRTQDKTIDKWLHIRIANAAGFLENVTYGDFLTGGSVLSSLEEKDRICSGYTDTDFVIGGEMEGNALFQLADADSVGIPGMVVKGICDWGVAKNDIFSENDTDLQEMIRDEKKDEEKREEKEEKFKDSLQAYAMSEVVRKVSCLFNDKELFAVPKNIDSDDLKKRFNPCFIGLIIACVFSILNTIALFFEHEDNATHSISNKYNLLFQEFMNNQLLWVLLSVVLIYLVVKSSGFFHRMRLSGKYKADRLKIFEKNDRK